MASVIGDIVKRVVYTVDKNLDKDVAGEENLVEKEIKKGTLLGDSSSATRIGVL